MNCFENTALPGGGGPQALCCLLSRHRSACLPLLTVCPGLALTLQMACTEARSWSTWSRLRTRRWAAAGWSSRSLIPGSLIAALFALWPGSRLALSLSYGSRYWGVAIISPHPDPPPSSRQVARETVACLSCGPSVAPFACLKWNFRTASKKLNSFESTIFMPVNWKQQMSTIQSSITPISRDPEYQGNIIYY